MYRAHKWLGILALGLMLVHNQFDPDFEDWVRESGIGDFAKYLGEFAFYGLITLILFSWIKRIPVLGWEIPYQLWWFTHRLTGAFFALVVVHLLLVDTPYAWNDPLAVYLNVFSALGLGSYPFVQFLARRLRRRAYRVSVSGFGLGERRTPSPSPSRRNRPAASALPSSRWATGRGVSPTDSHRVPRSRWRAPMVVSIFARAAKSRFGSLAVSESSPFSPDPKAFPQMSSARSTCSIACAASRTLSALMF